MKNNKIYESPVELVVGNPLYENQKVWWTTEEETFIQDPQDYAPQDHPIQEDIFHFEEPDEYEEYMQGYNMYYTPTTRE